MLPYRVVSDRMWLALETSPTDSNESMQYERMHAYRAIPDTIVLEHPSLFFTKEARMQPSTRSQTARAR
ncbi:hypothetical protein NDU88_001398 [Pleurodeles waltl]|uniref:Uncharacterized protein n=1 Tax=Pleurodeles waltl TaxID=8319 RepID=A0AAV7V9H3_PLEWA|nr:hypothetical protein NDU88_001398 [Pleurodeles waltl]